MTENANEFRENLRDITIVPSLPNITRDFGQAVSGLPANDYASYKVNQYAEPPKAANDEWAQTLSNTVMSPNPILNTDIPQGMKMPKQSDIMALGNGMASVAMDFFSLGSKPEEPKPDQAPAPQGLQHNLNLAPRPPTAMGGIF